MHATLSRVFPKRFFPKAFVAALQSGGQQGKAKRAKMSVIVKVLGEAWYVRTSCIPCCLEDS